MGYCTDYDFSNNRQEVIDAINEISGYSDCDYGEYQGVKWYHHHEHMKQVSLMFPDEVLMLKGVGEEQGDIWKAYYKSGKVQIAKAVITFEPFDESKLK
jgi:hypothetical protein